MKGTAVKFCSRTGRWQPLRNPECEGMYLVIIDLRVSFITFFSF